MVKWLYDSGGHPNAFLKGDKVFSKSACFIGRLVGDEVWHGSYRGEIVKDARFLYKLSKGTVLHGTAGVPGTPAQPSIPASKKSVRLPSGYRDIDLEKGL